MEHETLESFRPKKPDDWKWKLAPFQVQGPGQRTHVRCLGKVEHPHLKESQVHDDSLN